METAKKNAYLAAGVLLILAVWYYRDRLFVVAKPLLWGAVLTVLFAPIARRLEKKLSPGLTVAVIYGTLILLFGGILLLGGRFLWESGAKMLNGLPELWRSVTAKQGAFRAFPELRSLAEEKIPSIAAKIGAWDALGAAGAEAGKFFIGLALSAYFLKDRAALFEETVSLFPARWNGEVQKTAREMGNVFGVYLRGRLVLSVAVGLLSFPVFYFCAVPYAGLFAVCFGLFDILPFFGPLAVSLPAVLLAISGSFTRGGMLAALLFLIEEAESLYLQPRLLGGALQIHPATSVLVVLLGTVSFGFFGAILSIPMFAAGKILVKRIFSHVV